MRALDGSFPEAATACGVNVVSGNYWQSDLQKLFVWSFAETTNLSTQGCVATLSHGRWDIQDCAQEKRMACMGKNDTDWVLSLKPALGRLAPAVPGRLPAGRADQRLRQQPPAHGGAEREHLGGPADAAAVLSGVAMAGGGTRPETDNPTEYWRISWIIGAAGVMRLMACGTASVARGKINS